LRVHGGFFLFAASILNGKDPFNTSSGYVKEPLSLIMVAYATIIL